MYVDSVKSFSSKNKFVSEKPLLVCTFYQYHSFSKLPSIRKNLLSKGRDKNIRGLILISTEGLNATLTGASSDLTEYIQWMKKTFEMNFEIKQQISKVWGFKNLHVKIKKEIVKSGKPDTPPAEENTHLSPQEWESEITSPLKPILIDIRNTYETQIGKFKNALDMKLKCFKNFGKKFKSFSSKAGLSKDKKIFIYCTGGVRCEKALSEMKSQGFKNVWQLKGGVLNYLKDYPHSQFEGDLFVFDHRVSLDQNLKPSGKYHLCPHCGQPGRKQIKCRQCCSSAVVCQNCFNEKTVYHTCSKNCSYHHKKGHRNKKTLHS